MLGNDHITPSNPRKKKKKKGKSTPDPANTTPNLKRKYESALVGSSIWDLTAYDPQDSSAPSGNHGSVRH